MGMFDVLNRVVGNAWAGLWRDPPALRRELLLPVSALMLVRLAPLPRYSSLNFWFFLIAIFACIALVVNVQRYMLLRPGCTKISRMRSYAVFGGLLVAGVLSLLLVMLICKLLPPIPPLIGVLAGIAFIYVASRLSLVLPDQAVGRTTPLQTLWSWSKGNGWKLTWVLVVPLVLMAFGGASIWRLASWLNGPLAGFVGQVICILIVIFGAAVLSCAYEDLRSLSQSAKSEVSPGDAQA